MTLRQYAITADIGLCLEALTEKICVYLKDQALLSSIYKDLDYITQQAGRWHMDVPFHGLERHSSLMRSGGRQSFRERSRHMFEDAQPLSGKYQQFQLMALRFMKDPTALTELRLPRPSTSRR